MRKIKFILDRQSLEIIFTSFIRPVLECADVVWNNCTQYEINTPEKIQIPAAQIATGATKVVSLEMLYQETVWEPLEKRRYKHKLCLFYQMDNGVSSNYLSSLIPAYVEDFTIYNLRNANNLRHTLTRTQLYYRSFLPSSIRAWNDLALEVRQSSSIQSFKYQLNKNLKGPLNIIMPATDYLRYDILDLEQIAVLSIIICFPKILSIVLTVPVLQ